MSEAKDLHTAIEDLKKVVSDVVVPPLERLVLWLNGHGWVQWIGRKTPW